MPENIKKIRVAAGKLTTQEPAMDNVAKRFAVLRGIVDYAAAVAESQRELGSREQENLERLANALKEVGSLVTEMEARAGPQAWRQMAINDAAFITALLGAADTTLLGLAISDGGPELAAKMAKAMELALR